VAFATSTTRDLPMLTPMTGRTRRRLSRLREGGERADLDVAEPELAESVDSAPVLVEPGGDAER
jgi:hypothetical protein